MFKVGDIVKYAPAFCGDGEQYYIHMVKEEDRGAYLIATLNSLLTLGSSERVTEDMIVKAKKYEVVLNRNAEDRKYIITDTEDRKFFAGYDDMGSVNWVDSDPGATGMDLEEAEQIVRDLESADEDVQLAEPAKEAKRENAGYEIVRSMKIDEKHEIVIGKHPTAPAKYVVWDCYCGNDYNNGGYCSTFRQALYILAEWITKRYDNLPMED